MIGIKQITHCVADSIINTKELATRFNVDEEFLEKKTGFLNLYQLGKDQDILNLIRKNLDLFKSESDIDFEKIGLIVGVTQNPDKIKMPHMAAFVQDLICKNHFIPTFDISLGCSGWVYGIEIVKSFMESNSISNALLITCDPYSRIIDSDDKNTSLLFSDGCSITWISQENSEWEIGRGVYGTDGGKYQTIYRCENEKLTMNGRFLFETVVQTIPTIIESTLAKNKLSFDDVDRYVIHQASRYLVDYIAEKMKQKEKMSFGASNIGNIISSSIPSVFNQMVQKSDNIVSVCGFGVGFSWASNILRRVNNE